MPDGRIQVTKKGTLALLEEWLLTTINWPDKEAVREVNIKPLRDIRRLRQGPAHALTKDVFSDDFYARREQILWSVFNSLSNIRGTFRNHPQVPNFKVPDWLDEERIDVF